MEDLEALETKLKDGAELTQNEIFQIINATRQQIFEAESKIKMLENLKNEKSVIESFRFAGKAYKSENYYFMPTFREIKKTVIFGNPIASEIYGIAFPNLENKDAAIGFEHIHKMTITTDTINGENNIVIPKYFEISIVDFRDELVKYTEKCWMSDMDRIVEKMNLYKKSKERKNKIAEKIN